MIDKPLHEIEIADLENLVANRTTEGQSLEFKRDLPGNSDADKARFLAAVSSFSNTAGGDLIYGIREDKGLAVELCGTPCADPDAAVLRLENLLREGIEPRLPDVKLRILPVTEDRVTLIVRAGRSWSAPHRVKLNNHFYGRSSAGRYPLDVGEIRSAMILSESLADKVRSFRAERLIRIRSREAPVPLCPDPGWLVFHIVPLSAFRAGKAIDISLSKVEHAHLLPISKMSERRTYNLDGAVSWSMSREDGGKVRGADAYVQLFRSGAVESALNLYRPHAPDQLNFIYAPKGAEPYIVQAFEMYMELLRGHHVGPPYYCFFSLLEVGRLGFVAGSYGEIRYRPDSHADLLLSEIFVDDTSLPADVILRPAFDALWQAYGFERAFTYDDSTGRLKRGGA